jgi:hypothetical protein
MEEGPPIWRVAVNKLNKQPRTADEGWSSSLGVGRGANNPSPQKTYVKNYPCIDASSGDNNPEENYSPIRIFGEGGGGSVSRRSITQP